MILNERIKNTLVNVTGICQCPSFNIFLEPFVTLELGIKLVIKIVIIKM